MKKSDILTLMIPPGVYTLEYSWEGTIGKQFWFPFKRRKKIKKIMIILNGR